MKNLITLVLFFLTQVSFAQNLVPNPSFEDTVPHGGYCDGPIEWSNHWFNPTLSTPDFFCYNPSSVNCTVSSLNNGNGYQLPRTGYAYAGVYTWAFESRDYIAVRLDSSLSMDCTYFIEYYVSRANGYGLASDKIGCAFTSDTSSLDTTIFYLPLTPAIESQPGVLITDTQNWVRISGYYVANGNEQFFLIGNFHDDADTYIDTASPSMFYYAYYYIDDVKILSCDSTLALEEKSLQKENELLSVFPNPAMDNINFFYSGNNKMDNAEILDQSGRLLLRQKLRGGLHQSSISVAALVSGIYIIKINFMNGENHYKKIEIIN